MTSKREKWSQLETNKIQWGKIVQDLQKEAKKAQIIYKG